MSALLSIFTQDSISFNTYILYLGVLIFIFVVYMKFFKRPAKLDESSESDEDEKIEEREFSVAELKKFDGKNNEAKKVYIAAQGKVYDVSHSGFYTVGGPYHIFAGADATICLAKNSFDTNLLNTFDISKLTLTEKDSLYGFVQQFEMKYTKVGWVKEWRETHGTENKEEEEDENPFAQPEMEKTTEEKKKQ